MRVGASAKKPLLPDDAPSAWMLIIASASRSLANAARSQTHGPQSSYEFVVRVISTRAPADSSRALSRLATRHVKVASGNPELVAVPDVLQPLTIAPLKIV
jgi:hypothetical protein